MKKQYGAIFATLFLCIAMHAQDFQPMEYNGLLYPEIPPRVEYSLTPLGESLMPHVDSLIGWAVEHFQDITHGKVLV